MRVLSMLIGACILIALVIYGAYCLYNLIKERKQP